MTKLSETQRAVLAAAIERKDRCLYPLAGNLKGGAVGKVAGSLFKHGLIEEVPAQGGQTVWRQREDGTPLTLRATRLARKALDGAEGPDNSPVEAAQTPDELQPAAAAPGAARKRGAGQQALLALLRRPDGATLAELQQATGWQPHSVRGALSGLIKKKLGHEVTSAKEVRGRVYRITS